MGKKKAEKRGNYFGEWFGFRVYPPSQVDDSPEAVRHQSGQLCPFIGTATNADTPCAKQGRTGLCTVTSDNPDTEGDWLACPFRILDQHFTLLSAAIRTVRRVHESEEIALFPVSVLEVEERRTHIVKLLEMGAARVFLFTGSKLGGEVDIGETDSSPGGKWTSR